LPQFAFSQFAYPQFAYAKFADAKIADAKIAEAKFPVAAGARSRPNRSQWPIAVAAHRVGWNPPEVAGLATQQIARLGA